MFRETFGSKNQEETKHRLSDYQQPIKKSIEIRKPYGSRAFWI